MARFKYLWISPLLVVLRATSVLAQNGSAPTPYEYSEAYKVYSAILPYDSTASDQKAKTVVIQIETVPFADCIQLADDAPAAVKEAIADYTKQNEKKWLLQRSFELDKPYILVSSDELKNIFSGAGDGWDAFFGKYPDSRGYIEPSAVGFNADKTFAVVYMGHLCHWLCGGGTQRMLEKIDGKWQPAKLKAKGGCAWAS